MRSETTSLYTVVFSFDFNFTLGWWLGGGGCVNLGFPGIKDTKQSRPLLNLKLTQKKYNPIKTSLKHMLFTCIT